MNKKQILLDFIMLTTTIQRIGNELLHTKKYESISDLFNDILTNLSENEIETPSKSIVSSGIVDKDRTMFEIGEDQALMIFGEPQNFNLEE